MTTPNLGLALAAGPDTIAAALITKFDGNFSTLDTVIGNKVDKGAPITNLITTTAVAGGVPLVAKGILLQSGNLFEARDSTDVVKANITPTGDLYIRGVLLAAAASPLSLISNNATERPLLLKGFTAQSANHLEVQDSSGTILDLINSLGHLTLGAPAVINGASGFGATLNLQTTNLNRLGIVIKGSVAQAGNYFELQDNSGTIIARARQDGSLAVGDGGTAITSIATGAGATYSGSTKVAAALGLILRAVPSQTGNFIELQNSAGAALSGFEGASGRPIYNASLAGNGGSIAIGASLGSMYLMVDGTARRVPYFT